MNENFSYRKTKLKHRIWTKDYSLFTEQIEQIENSTESYIKYEDALVFKSILEYQSMLGITADLLEIGCMKGKMASIMATTLKKDEKLYLADLFDHVVEDKNHFYENHPSEQEVIRNILVAVGEKYKEKIIAKKGLSSELAFETKDKFRFIHIDAGHQYDDCYKDLITSNKYLIKGGVVAIDDYYHKRYPEVKDACEDFLKHNSNFVPFLDLNRSTARGRVLYLTKKE